jgi:hypothetical protein
MTYLLDVNALLALGIQEHEFHERTARWVKKAAAGGAAFATCAITELGFLRVLLQLPYAGATVAQGQKLLQLLKSSRQLRFPFLVDDQDAAQLPHWVKWPKQITDGHLIALAKAHDAVLATLDEGIRGAFVIPRQSFH